MIADEYKDWLLPDKNDAGCFKCKYCDAVNSKPRCLHNMGKGALDRHMKSAKHKELQPGSSSSIQSFFTRPSTASSSSLQVADDKVVSAEILWTLYSVQNNFAPHSCDDIMELCQGMFPDSKVAQSCKLGKTKQTYTICFGLAPYFQNILYKKISDSSFISVSFDECFNQVLQKAQVDYFVRYFDDKKKEVVSQYLSSQFIGHSRAEDLKKSFASATKDIDLQKVVHIGMDGPNVNKSLFKKIEKDRESGGMSELLNMGTCSLHIVHGAFQSGVVATGWGLKNTLVALHFMFNNTAARREDYIQVTGNHLFPKMFCATRWLEDVSVAERAIEMWPHVLKIMHAWQTRKITPEPKSKSYADLKAAIQDPLVVVKLYFFCYIAEILQPFLRLYQRDDPLIPYMEADLLRTTKRLLEVFVKPQLLSEFSLKQLRTMDYKNVEHHLRSVELGCAGSNLFLKLQREDNLENDLAKSFQADCKRLVITVVQKITDRLSTGFSFFRKASSLNPKNLDLGEDVLLDKFKSLVHLLTRKSIFPNRIGDQSLVQFRNLISSKTNQLLFKRFDREKRLDNFYFDVLEVPVESALSSVLQVVMVINNGQAEVERGFSLNNSLLENNMSELNIISRRIIKDYLYSSKLKPAQVTISREMKKEVRCANARYKSHLEEQRKEKIATEKAEENVVVETAIKEYKTKINDCKQVLSGLNQRFVAQTLKAADESVPVKSQEMVLVAKGIKREADSVEARLSTLNKELEVLKKRRKMV